MPKLWLSLVLLVAAGALAALLALRTPMGIDYPGAPATLCDCAAAPVRALAHARVHEFLATQPVMGSASLLLRAPFAALGLHLGNGSELDLYRLGAFPCLLAAGLLAVYLLGRMRELRRPPFTCTLIAGLVAVNPLTSRALRYGHPEELLAAALCVGAILAAGRRRPLVAGVLVGAAVATKQWAVLAVLPVLVAAASEDRVRTALAAAAAAGLLIVPMAAGDLHRFISANHGAGIVGGSAMPSNIWFGFGTDVPVIVDSTGHSTAPRALPTTLAAISHPLILVAGFGLALLWWRRRRDAAPEDALLLFALIALTRCLLDPMTNSYYHLPVLMSLAAWEGLRRRGAPVITVTVTLLLATTMAMANSGATLVHLNRFYLAWAVPLAGLLAALAFVPGRKIGARSREEVLRWAD